LIIVFFSLFNLDLVLKETQNLASTNKNRNEKCLRPLCSYAEQEKAFMEASDQFEDFKKDVEKGQFNGKNMSGFPPCEMLKGKFGAADENIGITKFCEMYYTNLEPSVEHNLFICLKFARLRSIFSI
jgi:hypothetical protein